MAKVSLSEFEMPSAELGAKNPHAALFQAYGPIAHYADEEIPVDSAVPYRFLDQYDRGLKPKAHRAVVLESDRLKATFLLDLGCRLWSLIHKPSGRELVYVNPVFQPANFGIRNAWFSGGIEWNQGIFGHGVFTCVPGFAARTLAPDGTDGLRFWDYERVRGFVWQVDIWAPEGSDFLYWSPRLVNPHDETIPMYWWTCIAVTEEPGGRVLAPATRAIEPGHAMGEETFTYDLTANPDITYPQRRDLPRDTYFDIPADERPWVAHVSADGRGVVHFSSPRLIGRKQWVWGMEHCGRRWQDWLSPGGPPYIEIQGGLAQKQSDYIPMPPKADWSWLECYGPVEGVDASNWSHAVAAVKTFIPEGFEEKERQLQESALAQPTEPINLGDNWGALEIARRAKHGLGPLCGPETPFPHQSGLEIWEAVLNGIGPDWNPAEEPGGYAGAEWRPDLEALPESAWTQLQLGVIAFEEGDKRAARSAWQRSYALSANGWALRNLAILDKLEGDLESATRLILEANELLPNQAPLIDETCRLLAEAKAFDLLETYLQNLKPESRERARCRLADAQVALHRGRLEETRAYFERPCDLVDIREAETSVSNLWRALCESQPAYGNPRIPPPEWDFRMKRDP